MHHLVEAFAGEDQRHVGEGGIRDNKSMSQTGQHLGELRSSLRNLCNANSGRAERRLV